MFVLSDIYKGPTLFAPLFAAVIGRALLKIVQWRLEQGEKLGRLDQIIESTTMFGTITSQVKHRAFNLVGITLICVWALSPIGGQASNRVFGLAFRNSTFPATLSYLDLNNTSGYYELWTPGGRDDFAAQAEPDMLFRANFFSPKSVRDSGQDLWGNIKIPMMEALVDGTSKPNQDGWIEVPSNGTTYASLVGVPVSLNDTRTNVTFSMDTAYWVLDCPMIEMMIDGNSTTPQTLFPPDTPYAAYNSTDDFQQFEPWHLGTANGSSSDRIVTYLSQEYDPQNNMTFANCTMRTSYVEVSCSCTGTLCRANRIRNSTQPHPPPSWTVFDADQYLFPTYARMLTGAVSNDTSQNNSYAMYPVTSQSYIVNPDVPWNTTMMANLPPLYSLSKTTFETRLAQLMNTYWNLAIGPLAVPAGFVKTNLDVLALEANATTLPASNVYIVTTNQVFVCHIGWLVALLLILLVLFLVGTIGLAFSILNRGPALAMNISNMVRDNSLIHRQPSTACGNVERSRLMKDVTVRYGDLLPNERVGKVGIGWYERGPDLSVAKLVRGKEYC